jgi:hypothetical protein
MILNIDMGTMYIKTSLVDENKKKLVTSEVIRVGKTGKGSIETLICSIVNNYSKRFDLKRVYIIPNPINIQCELIEYEPVLEEKYEKLMKSEIGRNRKEEKKKARMGNEYEPVGIDQMSKYKYEPVNFKYELNKTEVYHKIEYSDLVSSKLYVEYVNSDYLRTLTSVTSVIQGKDIRIISPIRLLKSLPFPKTNRIIINYGHRTILTVVVEVNSDGSEYIKEVFREIISDDIKNEPSEMAKKHELPTLVEDPVYMTELNNLQSLKERYNGYEMYVVGGNATYVQSDLFLKNRFEEGFTLPKMPLVIENLLIPSMILKYEDFQYNNLQMNLKNRIVSMSALSTQASSMAMNLGGSLAVATLLMLFVYSYGVNAEYLHYTNIVTNLETSVVAYTGDGNSIGKIQENKDLLEATVTGKTKNYYSIAELLRTLSAPLEIESIDVNGKNITVVAYSDNVALVRQFLESIKAKQITNKFTQLTLSESDITTVYRNGRKLDRVVFEGKIY